MYKKHKITLGVLSVAVGLICSFIGLRVVCISSDIVSVVSISSALYLATYAGIQASTMLRDKLMELDTVHKHRTQRAVLNSYIQVALVLNIVTIIIVCANSMVSDKIAQYDIPSELKLLNCILPSMQCKFNFSPSVPTVWLITERILNFSATALFVANLVQMYWIGLFVVNRISFDK